MPTQYLSDTVANEYEYFLKYAQKLCKNRDFAKELVQESFVKASIVPADSVKYKKTCFVQIMRRTFIDLLRYKNTAKRHAKTVAYAKTSNGEYVPIFDVYVQKGAQTPLNNICFNELEKRLEKAIANNTTQMMRVFKDYVLNGMDVQTIASKYEINPSSVRQNVFLSRQYLKEALSQFLQEYEKLKNN